MTKNLALVSTLVILLISCAAAPAAALEVVAKSPYSGAIVVDAATGKALFEDDADVKAYPASITKLMVLLVALEAVEARHLTLTEPVTVTAQASRTGGSQVYLKDNEVFPVEELLYALIVKSANDAATAAKGDSRAIAVMLGASSEKVRNVKAKEILAEGLEELAAPAPSSAPAAAE